MRIPALVLATTTVCLLIALGDPTRAAEIKTKPFDVQSGIIEKTRMTKTGPMTSKTVETMYFKDWGRIRSTISTETTTSKFMNKEQVQVVNKFTLMEGTTLTTVDLDTRKGTRMENPMAEGLASMTRGQASDMADRMAMAMKMKTTPAGQAIVAGKTCDVTQAEVAMLKQTTRTYIWKNIVLKMETKSTGSEMVEEATSVKTDVAIPADKFTLPKGATITTMKMP